MAGKSSLAGRGGAPADDRPLGAPGALNWRLQNGRSRPGYDAAVPNQTNQAWVEPVVLEGHRVRLEPLRRDHLDDLALVAFDPALWRWTIMGPQNPAGLERWLELALANAEAGTERPFATINLATGRAIGSSRFMSIVPEHRRLEIGWTWVGTAYQRSGANREAKLLQLGQAFEVLGANRVEFKTHARNEQSRTALAGIGATFEGVFRNHMIMPDGSIRHSAYFSVIAEEWPEVKAGLEASLARYPSP
jgi:RimJ/RimL family protein N-acetyltransferase